MGPFDRDVLVLAFARHVVDGLPPDEALPAAAVDQLCPLDRLQAAGLFDGEGQPTEAFAAATEQALVRLPEEFTREEKLDLLTQWFEVVLTDGHLERGEGASLFRAGQLLGVRASELDAHLDTLTEHVGSLDLDALEPD